MRRPLRSFLLATTIAALLALLARPAPDRAAAAPSWSACGDGFECSTISVPVDYGNPQSATLELALARLPSAARGTRVGSIVVNPGGPGGSGIDFLRSWAKSLGGSLRDRFDIVSFDPRGVGASSPVVCHTNIQAFVSADPTPDTQAEWDNLQKVTKDLADECARKYGELLSHLGTKDVARDLDRVRAALGDEKLTYFGFSYGTEIGQVYADMFPAAVRAMVLDGSVDLALDPDTRSREQAAGFERDLQDYLADCRKTNCALTKRGDPERAIDDLMAQAEVAPIPARGKDRPAGPGEVFLGVLAPLYDPTEWPVLTRAVNDGLNGDGSLLVTLTDRYLDRKADGSYSNQLEMNTAVNCLDDPPSRLPVDFKAYQAAAATFAGVSPHFGPAFASGLGCLDWKAKPDPLQPPSGHGAGPILVVTTTGDPATPYQWGVAVSKQLESAVLLTYRGDGHAAYVSNDACITSAVNDYLLRLALPATGTVCGTGPAAPAAPTESATPAPQPSPGATATRPARPTRPVQSPLTGNQDHTSNASVARSLLLFGALAAVTLLVALVMRQTRR